MTQTFSNFDEAAFDAGGVIDLPEGVIKVTRGFTPPGNKPFVLRGKGMGVSIIHLAADLGDDHPLFKLAGNTNGGIINASSRHAFHDLTIRTDEPDGQRAPGRKATAVHLWLTFATRFDRVEIIGFNGPGIRATSMWDGCFTDVHIARCGRPDDGLAALHLDDIINFANPDGTPIPGPASWGACNNNHFLGCRFENGSGLLAYLGKTATKNQFMGCKFHGQLPAGGGPSAPFDHVEVVGFGNSFIGCNLVRAGANGFRLQPTAHGTIITACTLQHNQGFGIYASKAAKRLQIAANVFPEGWEPKNVLGEIGTF